MLGFSKTDSAAISRETIQKIIERQIPDSVFFSRNASGKALALAEAHPKGTSRVLGAGEFALGIAGYNLKMIRYGVKDFAKGWGDNSGFQIPPSWVSSVARPPEAVFAELSFGVLKTRKFQKGSRDWNYQQYAEQMRNRVLNGNTSIPLLEDLLMVYLSQFRKPDKAGSVEYTIKASDSSSALSIGRSGTKYYPCADPSVEKKETASKPLELTEKESLFLRITSEMLLFHYLQQKGEI